MQKSHSFFLDTYDSLKEEDIETILFDLIPGDRVFLIWDLGSGKSTLARAMIRRHFSGPDMTVRSPTYTYYQRYSQSDRVRTDENIVFSPSYILPPPIYHFDLYRVESADDLHLIWVADILDDPLSICIIEWPEILGDRVIPTRKISVRSALSSWRIYDRETLIV